MREEQLFSQGGYYAFLLDSNVLLHREAIAATHSALSNWLQRRAQSQVLTVLDLACGGMPVAISTALSSLAPQRFAYTGVDINADQVRMARGFSYPSNIIDGQIIEGSAWTLPPTISAQRFDIIYSGMNLHHAIPEELSYLAQQLGAILAADGIFISHDVYRPEQEPYLRRPAANPRDPSDSFRLVDARTLARAGIAEITGAEYAEARDFEWREDYLQRMRQRLLARGADPTGTDETIAHMRDRDFPVSVAELSALFRVAGFSLRELDLNSMEPLVPYVSFVTAQRTQ